MLTDPADFTGKRLLVIGKSRGMITEAMSRSSKKMTQRTPRVVSFALACAAALFAQGCAPESDGRDVCTLESVGNGTGSKIISVSLLVPESYMTGAEISNGGIHLIAPDCEYALNAFLSDETAEYVISQVKDFRWTYTPSGSKVAEAEMLIWRFRDSSHEPRFFVLDVMEMKEPDTLPRFSDRANFQQITDD